MNNIAYAMPSQHVDFLQASACYPAICGGFGSGKTECLIVRLLMVLFSNPGSDVGYYAPTYDLIRLIAWPRFVEKLEAWGIKSTLNKQENRLHVHGNGSVIFRTMDNPARIVGYEVADSGVDELDTLKLDHAEDAWNKIIARNRQKKDSGDNTVAVATTPEGFKFVYKRWHKQGGADYQLFRVSTRANRKHLPKGYIEKLEATYPDNVVQAYIDGHFVNLTSGRVYPEFDRKLNHTDATLRESEPIHIGMDFNINHMASVINVIRKGQPIAVDEITEGRDTPYMIDLIKERYKGHHITIYPDASSKHGNSTNASQSDLSLLRDARFAIRTTPGNPLVRDRVLAFNGIICARDGQRRYLINTQKCPNLTDALEQQVYDKNGSPDKSGGLDHILDADGYFIYRMYPVVSRVVQSSELPI